MTVWQRIRALFPGAQRKHPQHIALTEADASQLIQEIRNANMSYCGPPKLENIAQYLLHVRQQGISGAIIEAGVALGGSAILLGKLKAAKSTLKLFDVFSIIPAPSERDEQDAHTRYKVIEEGKSSGLGEDIYYGYVDNLLDKVKGNFRQFGLDPSAPDIEFFPGLFEDTLQISEPVAFAHIDCDWYDSVKICIDQITPHISVGGIIIFDDYSSYTGCKKAVDEFLEGTQDFEVVFHQRSLGIRRLEN